MMNLVLLSSIRFVAVAANQMLLHFSYYTALPMSARACMQQALSSIHSFYCMQRDTMYTQFVYRNV